MPEACLLCGKWPENILVAGKPSNILMCERCEIAFFDKFPSDVLKPYREGNYYDAWWQDKRAEENSVQILKKKTADWVLTEIEKYLKPGAKILEVGCAFGYFLEQAARRGFQPVGLEISKASEEAIRSGFKVFTEPLETADLPLSSLDAVVMIDVIEHLSDPRPALQKIRRILNRERGILVLATPDLGSLSRKVFGSRWPHFKPEHLYYYSGKGLRRLLETEGFRILGTKTMIKTVNLRYLGSLSRRYRHLPGFVNRWMGGTSLATFPFPVRSGLFCIASSPSVDRV